jgi:hypothetical protein
MTRHYTASEVQSALDTLNERGLIFSTKQDVYCPEKSASGMQLVEKEGVSVYTSRAMKAEPKKKR